jgi:hypothetical protein
MYNILNMMQVFFTHLPFILETDILRYDEN